MPTYGGWTGKVLRVDLTTRTTSVENTLEKYADFWGGAGIGYKVLWDETDETTGPWDPENRLVFSWGPLTGTGAPCGGRTAITALSPQHAQHGPATGHMGGHFSAEAKYAGWDAIIVQGKASGPVYIAIKDSKVEIVDCPQLWGNGVYRATAEIQQALGGSCQVAAIGQAGENLVAQSCIITDYSHSAGGQGSVMGSKNLKAIGVVGTGTVKIAADRRAWRTLIENAMAIVGSNNQAVVPNTLQAWAEYSPSNARWYAAPGRAWGAANPPVDTGICDPHDRQKVGYRCFKSDPGAIAYPYTVRMDGCHACPVRCHQALNVPTAAKWGVPTTATNTCVGWWGRGTMNASTWSSLPKADRDLRTLESFVVGKHVTDDYGLHNNYGTTDRGWNFILTQGKNGAVVGSPYAKVADKSQWSWLQWNVPDAEWNGFIATGGLIDLYKNGDLNFIKEFGRIMANKVGELGKFLAGPVDAGIDSWKDDAGNPMGPIYRADPKVVYWANGYPKHHSLEDGCQVGGLVNTGYNRDPQFHSWIQVIANGLPKKLIKSIADVEFARIGWGDNMGASIDASTTTPTNEQKARAAKWCICRKELSDATGLCGWMYPWLVSPLKERGYRGDLSLEAQYFSLATGKTMSAYEFDMEGARFYILQRCLTIRAYGDKDLRHLHDTLPAWGLAENHGVTAFTPSGSYYITQDDWEKSLDLFYEEWGFDKATGAPTRATLESFGMKSVADALDAKGLLPA